MVYARIVKMLHWALKTITKNSIRISKLIQKMHFQLAPKRILKDTGFMSFFKSIPEGRGIKRQDSSALR